MIKKSKFLFGSIIGCYLINNCYKKSILCKDNKQKLYSWGHNIYGQLGLGTNNNEYSPQLVEFFNNINIKDFFLGEKNSAIIDTDGNLYIWGNSTEGILCNGDSLFNKNLPILMNTNGEKFKKISIGNRHLGAITENNILYLWGNQEHNKLLDDKEEEVLDLRSIKSFNNRKTQFIDSPNKVKNLKVDDVFCNNDFTVILSDNKIFTVGYSSNGCLGSQENEI